MTEGNELAASAMSRNRPRVSHKLLSRKAAERQPDDALGGEAIEDSFPQSDEALVAAEDGASSQPTPKGPDADSALGQVTALMPLGAAVAPGVLTASTAPQPWSDEDESAFLALSARRKAAGHGRGRPDVGAQTITLGRIKPNPDTVVAVIVGMVAERGGSVSRADLVAAMAGATFPHPKAQPSDRTWCQGYVAGAIRNGFLVADAAAVQQTEAA